MNFAFPLIDHESSYSKEKCLTCLAVCTNIYGFLTNTQAYTEFEMFKLSSSYCV